MTQTLDYQVEEYRSAWVTRKIASLLGDNNRARHSELGRLLDAVTKAAAVDAIVAGHRHDEPAERWGCNDFDRMLTQASVPIDHLRWALTPSDPDNDGRVWSHRDFVLSDVRAKPEMRASVVRHKLAQAAPAKLHSLRHRAAHSRQHDAQPGDRLTAELCFGVNRQL